MKEITFKEYQNKVLEIYEFFEKICSSKKIKIIAHSGTLLGIVRHNNSFIPWDDDIDVHVSYKDFMDNYSEIRNEINTENSKYYLFNFLIDEEKINPRYNIARIYSKEKFKINTEFYDTEFRPFIDIFFLAPSNTFKNQKKWKEYERLHKMRWITGKGFNRYPGDYGNKKKAFKKNIRTYLMKIVYPYWITEKRISKPYNLKKGDWNNLRRVDRWSSRKVEYNLDKLILSNIRGIPIWISENFENELIETFGENWRIEKKSMPHMMDKWHKLNRRNIRIDQFLDSIIN